jgi:hypothetical protein
VDTKPGHGLLTVLAQIHATILHRPKIEPLARSERSTNSIFHHFFPARAGEVSKQVELTCSFRVNF